MGGAQETGNSWMEDEASSLDEKVRGKMAFSPSQGCGAGSTFIFPSRIRISIQYVDPDPGGKILLFKTDKNSSNCNFMFKN